MRFYDKLQLNQAGSKALIRKSKSKKEKGINILAYFLKIMLCIAFPMAFVMVLTMLLGKENSITAVVLLLALLVLRQADFGINAKHSVGIIFIVFAILAVGPRVSTMLNPVGALLVNIICIFSIVLLTCHNPLMFNHSTFILGYLLLQGYEVSGKPYLQRVIGLAVGAAVISFIFYINHRKRTYKRTIKSLFKEFDLNSVRSQWQIRITIAVSFALFLAQLLHIPRSMWIGIAVMSITLPFQDDLLVRVKWRTVGNAAGCLLFLIIFYIMPIEYRSMIGLLGGVGIAFSATYGWQTVFNSIGALSVATSAFGITGAIILRIFHNFAGSVYSALFDSLFHFLKEKNSPRNRNV